MQFEKSAEEYAEIEKKIGYRFTDRRLLQLAFVHRSYANESAMENCHNERLEFLGDSVLGLLVAAHLYQMLPEHAEGNLSSFRSRLVEANSCAAYVVKLKLEGHLVLGKGERNATSRGWYTILADFFEALVGAIFLDGGLQAAHEFFFGHFLEEVQATVASPSANWKALLQDWSQKQHQQAPIYAVVAEQGPDHDKRFTIEVIIAGTKVGEGIGSSKKEAQQSAAKAAIEALSIPL